MDIGSVDKNLKVETTLTENDIVWYNCRDEIFDIYGLYEPRRAVPFERLPHDVAEATSPGVLWLNGHTAGGRVRFSTDSKYVAIKYIGEIYRMAHMPLTGNTGFDLYIDDESGSKFFRTFVPPINFTDGYDSIIYLPEGKKYITINFPLYNNVKDLFIGVCEGASLDHGKKYKYEKPVVYYGSSITQGGCASRPGNAYQSIISRMLNCDHINLGFSGCGKGEKPMRDYIAGLDMSVFFMDYDHNAPDVEHLKATHEPLYLAVREKHQNIPIIMASKTDTENDANYVKRRAVIYETYRKAVERGENVYFIDGEQVFGIKFRDCCTVDGCHPNDYGFVKMAEYFAPYVEKALKSL